MKTKVGSKLMAIREDRKMTQNEFAEFLDIPFTSYGRIERNESSLEFEKVVDIADKLDVPVNELLPDNLSINNNNSEKSYGGVFFGSQTNYHNYYYGDTSDVIKDKDDKIKSLEEELEKMKQKLINGN